MTEPVSDRKGKFPIGWGGGSKYRSDYEVGTDRKISHTGHASGYVRSRTSKPRGFATLMQGFDAEEYRGKRLQMTAYVKAEKIKTWAGLWMRVDGVYGRTLSFDNMQNRPIKGTCDWVKHAIVLDVPDESTAITFGVLLHGQGRLWVDDFELRPVTTEVPTTGRSGYFKQPRNLDFEE
jgi:hypothetical protein